MLALKHFAPEPYYQHFNLFLFRLLGVFANHGKWVLSFIGNVQSADMVLHSWDPSTYFFDIEFHVDSQGVPEFKILMSYFPLH